MVSNAKSAFINNVYFESNSEYGILFQGRVGGTDSFVNNCTFIGNKEDIKEIHQSKNNKILSNVFIDEASEVLRGRNNILFLIGSQHKILDHLLDRINIDMSSIENFKHNIKYRSRSFK